MRNRSSGKPASWNTSSIASAQPGTLLACFRSAPLPAISAGAAKRKTCQNGKFHGITASTTPSGLKVTNASAPPMSTGSAREVALGVLGEVVAVEGAFLDLGAAVVEGFAHLLGHQRGELVGAFAKDRSGLADHLGAICEARPPPRQERLVGLTRGLARFVDIVLVVRPARLSGRGIDRLDRLARRGPGQLVLVGHDMAPCQLARAVTRQMVFPASSAISSAPVRSSASPTGRPRTVAMSGARKPVTTSIGIPLGRPSMNGTNTTL